MDIGEGEMTAISGTRRAMKEMADGTLRVQIDIDPRFRASFFEMFGQIDMPVALAPLVADFERKEPEKPKGGQLAKLAGMWCEEPEFWAFLSEKVNSSVLSSEASAVIIRVTCGVETRADLDHDEDAADTFHKEFRLPYMAWKRGDRGVAA